MDPQEGRERRMARRNFLYTASGIVLGAVVGPFGVKLFADKEPSRSILGAPFESFQEVVTEGSYTSKAHMEVVNETINPIESHRPLNPDNALVVRPGDRLTFRYDCEMTAGVAFSFVSFILPAGLKMVGNPWLRPSGDGAEEGEALNESARGWVFKDSASVNKVSGGVVAVVVAKYPSYLTFYWGGAANPPEGAPLGGLARAVLRVEPT